MLRTIRRWRTQRAHHRELIAWCDDKLAEIRQLSAKPCGSLCPCGASEPDEPAATTPRSDAAQGA